MSATERIRQWLMPPEPQKASLEPQKAITGPGAAVMSWGTPVQDVVRAPHQMMKDAQAVYARGNRWVKRAEMTISGRVGGVPWHLETDDGEEITDESSPELRAIRDLFEKPLLDEETARAYPSQPSTRRAQWGLTSRHAGLCNVAFWHLDELDRAMAFPQRIYLIRPDRMTPRTNNGLLIGWTIDADAQGGGTDLSLEEVLPFYLDQPDRGFFGTGLVESILSTTGLPSQIDRHALDTLSSGGRLPGIYAPSKDAMSDDVFNRLTSDLRTIKDMPDSSKRDVVAKQPIEFTPTAADMSSLNVIELSRMSRDDVLAHWGVPLSTIGGYTPAGMNSGETRKYDEAALWQNAVQFRVDMLYETIQYRLLDRLKAGGINVQMVIETPAFDDESPRYELASKATNLPLTNDERRALVGLPPIEGPLGSAVYMPATLIEIGAVEEATTVDAAKAKINIRSVRASVDRSVLPKMQKDLASFLDTQKREIAGKVRANASHLARKPTDAQKWWSDDWDKRLAKVLSPYAAQVANMTAAQVEAMLKPSGKASFDDLVGNKVLQRLLARVGQRIRGINETTREKVATAIREGIEAGDGAAQLGDRVEAAAAFDEYRAELIARTESAQVLNEAQLETFKEFDVSRVVAIDGDDDEECATRDGQEFDLEEAFDIQDHPNGTLDWVPVVG